MGTESSLLTIRLTKLSVFREPEWLPNHYERVWWQEETAGPSRIVAAVSEDQVETALRLAACASEPFLLLWVLHSPRGGSRPGRYQSPLLSLGELQRILRTYRKLFELDGRSDLWIHAQAPEVTIVIDRHDLIYAYGPAEPFVSTLHGFRNTRISIPAPHTHHYHPELDELEHRLASELDWQVSELRPEDEA